MKNIIVPTGYMGSGSSAITGLLSEFENVDNKTKSFEFVFLHCPGGLFDLEDNLLNGNNALKSDESIRYFEKTMNKLYNKKYWWVGHYKTIFGEDFIKYTRDYINKIQEFNFDGFWYMHEEVNFKMFIKLLCLKPFKILFKVNKKILKYNDGMRISYINKEDFYKYSKEYIYKIINLLSDKNIILDQLLLPFNLFRIDNYFDDDLKVFVVERDPRDVFILNKYVWPKKNCNVPFPTDVKQFCKFYDKMRKSEKVTNSNKIMRIKFEDLIYKYDDTLKDIMNFIGFNEKNHIHKNENFNPNLSIKNTQVFRNKKYAKEIKIIEKELTSYLYNFPYELDNDIINSIEFD